MASFTYTAKRQIKSGHTLGVDYAITIDLQARDGGMPEPVKTENLSLDGNVVTVLNRIDRIYKITTDMVPVSGGNPSDADFDEFFSSVAGGEVFSYDPDGTPVAAIMKGDATRSRNGIYFSYSFSIRLL